MATDSEIAAIIGGSIGGLLVFIIIVTIIVYMLCGSRSRKRRQEKKFHHLARHHHEPGHHSQNSTMSHMSSERLPKVGSNGLWVGSPGVYSSAAPAYYYGRPYANGLHRAPSDVRPPGFPGHAVYQSNNSLSNLRIYHSQQLTPVYEYINPTQGPNVVDIYQYGDLHHSRSRLIEQPPSSSWKKQKDNKNSNKKLLRSKSDATQEQRRHGNRRRTDSHRSSDTKSSANSKSSNKREARADIHDYKRGGKSKSTDGLHMGYDNRAFERDSGLATDSMKLQATKVNPINNVTDDEKKQVVTPAHKEPKTKGDDPGMTHYVYQGDIYAVPDKNVDNSNNPILDKMNSMLLEQPRRPTQYLLEDEVDASRGHGGHGSQNYNSAIRDQELQSDPIYSEVHENTPSENIIVTEVVPSDDLDPQFNNIPVSSAALLQPQPSTSHNIIASSPSLMSEKSEVSEDIGVKGKNVTAEAFEFLESYLSDDEDLHSPESRPTSPGHNN